MPTKLKLIYFNSRGRAEPIRLLLAAAKKEYEDVRKTPEEWEEMKADTSFGHLPVMKLDDTQEIGGSSAILRFLAKEFDMMGGTNLQKCKVDQIYEEITEIRTKLIDVVIVKDDNKKKELMKKFKDEYLPNTLKTLEKELKKSKKDVFVGNDLTIADIQFFHIVELLSSVTDISEVFSENDYPKLTALNQKVANNPGISAWLKKRPLTEN